MSVISTAAAGVAYFVLGGLWFTPLFGRFWDRAVGFQRPLKWRPSAIYYIAPLVGCLVAALAMSVLLQLIHPKLLTEALHLAGALLCAAIIYWL